MYFITWYHAIHNSYARAAILPDGKELVCFPWIEIYQQNSALANAYGSGASQSHEDAAVLLKSKWDADCTCDEMDLLNAALKFGRYG